MPSSNSPKKYTALLLHPVKTRDQLILDHIPAGMESTHQLILRPQRPRAPSGPQSGPRKKRRCQTKAGEAPDGAWQVHPTLKWVKKTFRLC